MSKKSLIRENDLAAQRIAQASKDGSVFLDLSGLGLYELPESLGQLSQLRELYLHRNQLSSVPESLGKLSWLRLLYLNGNRLSSIPGSLGQLSRLQELSLHDNLLSSVPDSLGQLSRLRLLYLHGNQLTSVPESLGQLSQLYEFTLSSNQISSVPDSLCRLVSLGQLSLDENQLSSIPQSFGRLTNLRWLSIASNQLTALPQSLRKLKALQFLFLHGNPALNIPQSILGPDRRKGVVLAKTNNPASILDYYFRSRKAQDRRPLAEAKLILVGRGEVGKTSLVRRLIENKFSRREDRTQGIRIRPLIVAAKKSTQVRLHAWDFGGQEIMHATHQFFLTDRSLYLLVLDGRAGQQEAEADYWLRLIGSFAPESPVLVVLNKFKKDPFEVNRRALQEKYPQVKGFFETDCDNPGKKGASGPEGFGIENLRKGIIREVNRLDDVWAAFPASWVDIKEGLPKLKRDFISFDDYRRFCAEHGEPEKTAQENLAGHLHRLGIALNFRDDPRLCDQHVLNPHWITEGIYTLLNSPMLANQGGELTLKDMQTVLDRKRYPSRMHPFLLNLMEKFELCLSYPRGDRYLIPELLAPQQPKAADSFHAKGNLTFQYHYPVIPPGLLPRFIVRTHVLSEKHRWRTGVILKFEGNTALVKADLPDRKVFISVAGPVEGRRRMLAVIREDFEAIHREIVRLNPEEMVPLPEHPEVVVPYRKLEVLERNNPEAIWQEVIGDEVVDIPVRALLNGVDLGAGPTTPRMDGSTRTVGAGPADAESVRVFFSYAHTDARHRLKLDKHLAPLRRTGLITNWYDREIPAGAKFANEISEQLKDSEIVLLLVSPDFVASDYCYEIELKQALEQHTAEATVVIPVIIRPTNAWDKLSFGELNALPKFGKAIPKWQPHDDGWADVAAGVERVAKKLLETRRGRGHRYE